LTDKLRAGVIGLGFGRRYADAFYELEKTELVAVCDLDEKKLRAAMEKYNVKGYMDYKKMFKEMNLDVVGIATPHNLHATQSIEAMKAGIHVLCVKPMATNIKDADAIIQTAKDTGIVHNTGYSLRYSPIGQKIKSLLDEGVIGRVFHASSYIRAARAPGYFFNCWNSWRGKKECGGQLLINQTIHHSDLFCFYFGDPVEVRGWVGILNLPIEVEDTAVFAVKFKSGVVVTFDNSIGITSAKVPGWNFEIYGEKGTISFPYSKNGKIGVFHSKPRPDGWGYEGEWEIVEAEGPKYMEVEAFLSAIEGKNTGVPPEEGKKGVEIAIACYRSHALGGKTVKLPLPSDDFSVKDIF